MGMPFSCRSASYCRVVAKGGYHHHIIGRKGIEGNELFAIGILQEVDAAVAQVLVTWGLWIISLSR